MEIQDGGPVKDFHDLKVWQKAHQLTLAVYQITAAFPREELYGLTSQTAAMQFLDTGQLGGGMRKKRRCRVCSFLLDRHGIGERVGVPPTAGERPEAHQAQGPRGTFAAGNGVETHADRAASKAER